MSIEKAFRDVIRAEIAQQLGSLREVIERLEAGASDLEALRAVATQLLPLASVVGPLFGALPPPPAPRTGAGRPRAAGAGGRKGRAGGGRAGAPECAIIDCPKPARTKGYCAAHYQKLRMLTKSGRRPEAWKDYAAPHSVEDLKLPRGRAAAKALRQAQAGKGA